MNKVILMGRLTREPEVRYTNGQNGEQMAIARFSLAVDRRFNRNEQTADFINCVAFGKQGEFAEKYLHQGTKVAACGRIQTGSYTNKDGQKVYTTDVVLEEIEFAESKNAANGGAMTQGQGGYKAPTPDNAGAADFMSIPDGIENDLPFK